MSLVEHLLVAILVASWITFQLLGEMLLSLTASAKECSAEVVSAVRELASAREEGGRRESRISSLAERGVDKNLAYLARAGGP